MNSCKLLPCGRIIFYNSSQLTTPLDSFPTDTSETEGDFIEPEPRSCMGLSHAAISDNPSFFSWINPPAKPKRARRGTKGISTHGRNLVRAGCHWLEEKFGKRNLTFLTATLPDEVLYRCTPETWAEVVNRFLKSLRYHLKGEGLCPEIVGCTEIQTSRLLKTEGIPPLHLHLLFQGRKGWGHWAIDKGEYQRLWSQACQSVWQVEANFLQSCRSESIYRSGVSYMSKYLSKGGDVLNQCIPELLPSAWYTISSSLKATIKATVSKCNNYLAVRLFEQIWDSDILTWARGVYSTAHGDGSQYLVAWVGQIRDRATYWKLKQQVDHCMSPDSQVTLDNYHFTF